MVGRPCDEYNSLRRTFSVFTVSADIFLKIFLTNGTRMKSLLNTVSGSTADICWQQKDTALMRGLTEMPGCQKENKKCSRCLHMVSKDTTFQIPRLFPDKNKISLTKEMQKGRSGGDYFFHSVS